ncbi:MAG: methionine adenosyltransferase [Candidatus Thermoplasmatota archaeon]|nr:methionine adenosyltransferase [Candidatus Thermoplasmatota archaeon]
MTQNWLFTSESVAAGHPDKLCDAISDAIVDACLTLDPKAKVAVETLVKGREDRSHIVLAGEVKLASGIDAPDYTAIARKTAAQIGYTSHGIGMDATSEDLCEVTELITNQSAHINRGVVQSIDEQGAGDQGLMFGYACDETESYPEHKGRWMPLAIALSQALTRKVSKAGLDGTLPWARPDAKSQVTLMHGADGQPMYADNIVIAVQHKDMIAEYGTEEAEQAWIREQVIQHIIKPVVPSSLIIEGKTIIHVNSTGRFADPGGPYADAGLTGRKIIVDTYGGRGRHGGGAFSGKDPTKVDRSAAYAARWAAKHVVAAGLSQECEIQLAYAIGVADPVSIRVDSFGSGKISDEAIADLVDTYFSFKPGHIIRDLGLSAPIYGVTAAGGHFGRKPEGATFPWEQLNQDVIDAFQAAL